MSPYSISPSPMLLDVTSAEGIGKESSQHQIESVGTEFESVFLSMLIKEMRNSLDEGEGGLFAGEGSDTYGSMFDLFIGKHMAESKPLGIGELLLEQYRQSASAAQDPESSIGTLDSESSHDA